MKNKTEEEKIKEYERKEKILFLIYSLIVLAIIISAGLGLEYF